MKSKSLSDESARTYVLVLDRGDEVMQTLRDFAAREGLDASRLSGIGAFERVTIGFFDWERKDYEAIPVEEQVEVVSLTGDIALTDGRPEPHVHVVLGRRDGSTRGGHLLEGVVRPTLELVLTESPEVLRRELDRASGLPLIAL